MVNNISAQFLTGGSPAAKFSTPGTTVTGVISAEPTLQQQRDFNNSTPLTWADGSPRMQLVVELKTAEGNQRLFIKGQLKNAVAAAVRNAGATGLDIGGSLSVTYTGNAAPAAAGLSPAKQYTAVYQPPTAASAEFLAAPAPAPAIPAPVAPAPVAPAAPVAGPANPFGALSPTGATIPPVGSVANPFLDGYPTAAAG
jgi:hypothetical protein